MKRHCRNNTYDIATNVCDACYGEYCDSCLVNLKSRKHPLCKECAVITSGVRGRSKISPKGNKKTANKRRKIIQEYITESKKPKKKQEPTLVVPAIDPETFPETNLADLPEPLSTNQDIGNPTLNAIDQLKSLRADQNPLFKLSTQKPQDTPIKKQKTEKQKTEREQSLEALEKRFIDSETPNISSQPASEKSTTTPEVPAIPDTSSAPTTQRPEPNPQKIENPAPKIKEPVKTEETTETPTSPAAYRARKKSLPNAPSELTIKIDIRETIETAEPSHKKIEPTQEQPPAPAKKIETPPLQEPAQIQETTTTNRQISETWTGAWPEPPPVAAQTKTTSQEGTTTTIEKKETIGTEWDKPALAENARELKSELPKRRRPDNQT